MTSILRTCDSFTSARWRIFFEQIINFRKNDSSSSNRFRTNTSLSTEATAISQEALPWHDNLPTQSCLVTPHHDNMSTQNYLASPNRHCQAKTPMPNPQVPEGLRPWEVPRSHKWKLRFGARYFVREKTCNACLINTFLRNETLGWNHLLMSD